MVKGFLDNYSSEEVYTKSEVDTKFSDIDTKFNGIVGKSIAITVVTFDDMRWYYNKCGRIVNFENKYIANVKMSSYGSIALGKMQDKPILDQMHLATNKHLKGSLMARIANNGNVTP